MADPSETTQVTRLPAGEKEQELLDAVRDLAAQMRGLQSEVHALRNHASRLPDGDERPGWDDPSPTLRDGGAWVRSLDTPTLRRFSIPWLALEIAFLVAVAVLAVVADLEPLVIAAVMVLAWLVVALAEWATARSTRQRHALAYGTFAPSPGTPEDPTWLQPPTERTALDVVESGAAGSIVGLPPTAD